MSVIIYGVTNNSHCIYFCLHQAKSDGSLAGAGAEEGGALGAGGKVRSRSLEPLTGLAMWSSEPQIIGKCNKIYIVGSKCKHVKWNGNQILINLSSNTI